MIIADLVNDAMKRAKEYAVNTRIEREKRRALDFRIDDFVVALPLLNFHLSSFTPGERYPVLGKSASYELVRGCCVRLKDVFFETVDDIGIPRQVSHRMFRY
jgi:hypothetical protein